MCVSVFVCLWGGGGLNLLVPLTVLASVMFLCLSVLKKSMCVCMNACAQGYSLWFSMTSVKAVWQWDLITQLTRLKLTFSTFFFFFVNATSYTLSCICGKYPRLHKNKWCHFQNFLFPPPSHRMRLYGRRKKFFAALNLFLLAGCFSSETGLK